MPKRGNEVEMGPPPYDLQSQQQQQQPTPNFLLHLMVMEEKIKKKKITVPSDYSPTTTSSCTISNASPPPLPPPPLPPPPPSNVLPKPRLRRPRRPRGPDEPAPEPGKRSSIYRGVTKHRWTGRYEAHLWDKSSFNRTQNKKGRQVYLGAYDDEAAAARTYDLAALKYWGPNTILNFPVGNYVKELENMERVTREEYLASLRRNSSGFSRGASKYRGVARHHHNGRWEARIGRVSGNKYLYLGTYDTQEEAAAAYDIAALEYRGVNAVTNFDMSHYVLKPQPQQQLLMPQYLPVHAPNQQQQQQQEVPQLMPEHPLPISCNIGPALPVPLPLSSSLDSYSNVSEAMGEDSYSNISDAIDSYSSISDPMEEVWSLCMDSGFDTYPSIRIDHSFDDDIHHFFEESGYSEGDTNRANADAVPGGAAGDILVKTEDDLVRSSGGEGGRAAVGSILDLPVKVEDYLVGFQAEGTNHQYPGANAAAVVGGVSDISIAKEDGLARGTLQEAEAEATATAQVNSASFPFPISICS